MENFSSPTARPVGIPDSWKDSAGAVYPFKAAWHYRNASGEPVGIVARFDNESGKQVIPFFKADGGKFKAGGPPAPVLFGLERLNGHKAAALVVEGEKAAAALHSLELLAVSAQGGAGNAKQGAWNALLGAPSVVFLPDNDAPGTKYCQEAAAALAALATPDSPLPELRLVRLPGLPAKGDVCDWLAARLPGWNQLDPVPVEQRDPLRAELLNLLEAAEPVPVDWLEAPSAKPGAGKGSGERVAGNSYVELPDGAGILWIFPDRHGAFQETRLSNFTARIVEELAKDDGQEITLSLRVTGCQAGRDLPAIDMTLDQFLAMTWAARQWTSACVVEPGSGVKDALRAAIQTLSHSKGFVERRTVYTHTGWRKVAGAWVYLHGGGALGASGPVAGIETDLGELARYALPDPSRTAQERLEAAQASSRYLALAALEIALPILACVFLAPLAQALNVDFMLWLEAASQSQKSSISAAAAAHFGATIDRTSLTANWTATAGSLEGSLFTLADSLAVIDDYAPQPSAAGQAALDATAARVIRGCGNRQGRGRLKADLTRQKERYPRGLVMATAEQWPQGESITARLFGVSLKRGDVDLNELTAMQQAAASGLLSRCMADFIASIARNREQVIADCKALWLKFREQAMQQGLTGRAPEQVAFLLTGAKLAANHYRAAGVELDTAAWPAALFNLAQRQAQQVLESQPADRFRNALRELLAAGAAHLSAVNTAGDIGFSSVARGRLIGWQNPVKSELYLLAAPALEVVNESLRKGDTPLNIKPAALWRQCRQRGWLLPGDPIAGGGERSSRVCWLDGKTVRVMVFNLEGMLGNG